MVRPDLAPSVEVLDSLRMTSFRALSGAPGSTRAPALPCAHDARHLHGLVSCSSSDSSALSTSSSRAVEDYEEDCPCADVDGVRLPRQNKQQLYGPAPSAACRNVRMPMGGLLPSRGLLLDRAQEAAQLVGDLVRGLHRAGVSRSGEYDKFGPCQCAMH